MKLFGHIEVIINRSNLEQEGVNNCGDQYFIIFNNTNICHYRLGSDQSNKYFHHKLKSEQFAELWYAEDLVMLELPVIWQASIRRNMHLIYFSDRLVLSLISK